MHVDVVLGKRTCRSKNDLSEARSGRTVHLRLEAGLSEGLGLSKGARQGQISVV